MDEKKNLILVKGENKTWQIERCRYELQDQRYQVTFANGKTYPKSELQIEKTCLDKNTPGTN